MPDLADLTEQDYRTPYIMEFNKESGFYWINNIVNGSSQRIDLNVGLTNYAITAASFCVAMNKVYSDMYDYLKDNLIEGLTDAK